MFITRKALPRRTFLRGAGTLLALPLLDAMVPSLTALAETPASANKLRRLGFVYIPMGCDNTRWAPPAQERLDVLSATLEPLEAVKQNVSVISNLELANAYPGTHATSNCAFLSAARPSSPKAPITSSARRSTRSRPSTSGRRRNSPRSRCRWICSRRWDNATTATPASTRTTCRGRLRRRRCGVRPIRGSSSSGCSATAAARRNAVRIGSGAPACWIR